MSIWRILSKIPWLFLINKGSDLLNTGKLKKEILEKEKNNSSLEKLIIEQGKLLAELSNSIINLYSETNYLKKQIKILSAAVIISIALNIISLIVIIYK
jgi:hypothetical protein